MVFPDSKDCEGEMDDEREAMSDEAQETGASEDGAGAPAEASTGADSQVDTRCRGCHGIDE